MVKSTSTQWGRDCLVAVDAGIHLAAIIRILNQHLPNAILQEASGCPATKAKMNVSVESVSRTTSPCIDRDIEICAMSNKKSVGSRISSLPPKSAKLARILSTGPFMNLELPHETARANGAYIIRNLISTYLITHPHLDHVSGFAVNSASFQQTSRPKRLAALPSTIDAIRDHIFNDIIWPNLSDENGGVGLLTYMRLVEGGNNAVGDGEGRGYIEVCNGLAVKCWSISHGQCMRRESHRGSSSLGAGKNTTYDSSKLHLSQTVLSMPGSSTKRESAYANYDGKTCAYDSSAFFLRDDQTRAEILIFGDVEPDCLSLAPRTARVWNDAANKVVDGFLKGILIECSYDESRSDETLFGHLAPRHLINELQVLAHKVISIKESKNVVQLRKRKRQDTLFRDSHTLENETESNIQRSRKMHELTQGRPTQAVGHTIAPIDSIQNRKLSESIDPKDDVPNMLLLPNPSQTMRPLEGLRIIVTHIKDTLKDGPQVSETILAQLQEHEALIQLGCIFTISKAGTSIWL